MQQRVRVTHANGNKRLRPKISNFEDEWHALDACYPPRGKPHQQLWRCADDDVRRRKEHSSQCRRDAEGTVVEGSLNRFSVGKWPKPCSFYSHSIQHFTVSQAEKAGTPFFRNAASWMVRKAREDSRRVTRCCLLYTSDA